MTNAAARSSSDRHPPISDDSARRPLRPPGAVARLLAVTLVVSLVGAGWLATPPAGQAQVQGMASVTTLSASGDSAVLVDSVAGIVYDLDPSLGLPTGRGIRQAGKPTFPPAANPGIRFLDAATFRFLSDDDLPLEHQPVSAAAYDPAPLAAVDEVLHLLYYASGKTVVIVDGLRRQVVGTIGDLASGPYEITDLHMSPDNRLWAQVAAVKYEAGRGLAVVELDPLAAVRGTGTGVVGSYGLVQPCVAPARGHGFGVSATAAYVTCTGVDAAALHQPASAQGVYTIPLAEGHLPRQGTPGKFFPVPGSYLHGWGMVDSHSDRVIMLSRGFGPSGAFVFDGRHQAMVGLIGQHNSVQGGCVNRHTGRFYAVTEPGGGDTGLVVGEARATPSPQGYGFPPLGTNAVFGVMACDPVRRHVFVKKEGRDSRHYYEVVRDNLAPYEASVAPDPDAATSNTPDDADGVDIRYQGLGRAFGGRVVLVGGYANLAFNFANVGLIDDAIGKSGTCPPPESGIGCGSIGSNVAPSSRELVVGAVGDPGEAASVSISNFSVTSAAEGAGRDAQTETEMDRPPAGDRWPYAGLLCSSGPGDGAKEESEAGATIECDPDAEGGPRARGAATADASLGIRLGADGQPQLPVGVGLVDATSEVVSRIDAKRGTVTTATAHVRAVHLRLGDVNVEIGDIAATAEVSAKGLPRTGASRYTRTIGRLAVNGSQVCGPCAPESVVSFLESLPLGSLRASLPRYDAESFTPTPGGYQAAVVRDRWEQLNDAVLNERSPYDLQVPALRLVLQEDSFQHSALLIDLAAPQAEAHRGIMPCTVCAGGGGSGGGFAPTVGAPGFDGNAAMTGAVPSTAVRTLLVDGEGESGPRRRTPLQQIVDGLRVVFTSPGRLGGVLLVWSVLACPVYLASRRRLVLQRMS